MSHWEISQIPDLTGKVAFVTGGNAGIGKETIKALLQKNAKVYMGARDYQKTYDAIEFLEKATGKKSHLIALDLGDLVSIRAAAKDFLSKESRLDILVNNAGIMAVPIDQLTKQGYDAQVGINALGHFFLTQLLLPALLATQQPRIINVSSSGHHFAPKGGFWWDQIRGPKQGSPWQIKHFQQKYQWYGQSKLGNILHTKELVKRYGDRGLISIAVHPGGVQSDLARDQHFLMRAISPYVAMDTASGALTQLFAATAPEATDFNGKYLVPIAKEGSSSTQSNDAELAERWWNWCEEQVKEF